MKASLLPIVLSSLVLAACGGGGGGSSSTSTTTNTSESIQTSVPTPTYGATSQEKAFFDAYNAFRSAQGLGLLKQDDKLDLASSNHLKYLTTNSDINFTAINTTYNRPQFHIEDSARPNFTGVQENNRAQYAGYAVAYIGETGAYGAGRGGAYAFSTLVDTIYHRAGLMFQNVADIGLAVGTDSFQTVVMEFGYKSGQSQRQASDYVGTYPANNQTGVPLFTGIETPNPFPDLPYSEFATKTGYPIHIAGEASTQISVTSFTVIEAGQSAPMDARLLTRSNDPNGYLGQNIAFLVAKQAFKPNTVYTVNFQGSFSGRAVAKTWQFTTGS